jgi:hypothetical protein
MPDGTIIRNVPEGTTRAQLIARLHKSPQHRGVLDTIQGVVSAGNDLLIGGLEGAYNAAAAVTDPIAEKAMNLVYGDDSGTQAVQSANRQRRAVVNAAERTFAPQHNPVARTAGRIAGTMAIPLPGKKLQEGGRLARTVYRAIQGAVGGAGVREVDESPVAPAVTGAVANVVLPTILSKVAQTRPARALLQTVASNIEPAPIFALGRKAQARAARFLSLGIDNPTTGMVTRDPAAVSFEQNTAKIQGAGEGLAQQMHNVEAALVEKGRSLVRSMGGSAGPEATGKAVEDVLNTKSAEMQRVTGRLYEKVRETRGDEPLGSLPKFREFIDQPSITDNAIFDSMRESINRRLARFEKAPVTINQAEELRKFIGGLGSGADPAVRMMRREMINALDDDVVSSVGDDAFKAARASARARFEEFGKTFPGKLADEGLAPELLTKRVLGDGVKLSDLRALKQSLGTGTDEQIARGQQAWRSLQAQAVDDLMSKSVDADGNLIGTTLARNFSKSAAKFRQLLEPDDFKTLRRLAAATRDVKALPVGHSVNTSNTAPTLANMFSNVPPRTKESWLKFLAKNGAAHTAAWLAAGPTANLALGTAQATMRYGAETKAAQALADRIRLAQSPEAAAAAIAEAQKLAASNKAVADFFNQAGLGRLIGGTAAGAAQ